MLAVMKNSSLHEAYPDWYPKKGAIGNIVEDDAYCKFFNLYNIEWCVPSMCGEPKRVNKYDVRIISDFVVVNTRKNKKNKPCDEAYKVYSIDDMTGKKYSYWSVPLCEYEGFLKFVEKYNGKYVGFDKHNNPCITINW